MGKPSKRRQEMLQKVERDRDYDVTEAIDLLKQFASGKFTESVDIAVNLGIDPRQADQNVRGSTVLPHGTGKDVKVAVFAQGDNAELAKQAGADLVGFEDLAKQIQDGEIGFDVVIATPDCMRVVGPLGRILGPRGLMPNPKSGTVTAAVEAAVKNAKSGQVQYRADRGGVIHGSVGQVSLDTQAIKENTEALIADLKKAKPASSKGTYVKKITMSTTMGPGLTIEEASLQV